MTFPTRSAVQLAKASGIDKLTSQAHAWQNALEAFQRMSLVSDYEDCIKVFVTYIDYKLELKHTNCLKNIYNMSKKDVLSIAMDNLLTVCERGNSKDKIAAATVINELFGEKHLIEDVKLTDKLMINLVDGGRK